MNILITGGAGYIGSHTVLELLNVGHSVVCVDNGCNAYMRSKDSLPESLKRVESLTDKKVTFYPVDIRDKSALDAVFKKVSFYLFLFIRLARMVVLASGNLRLGIRSRQRCS